MANEHLIKSKFLGLSLVAWYSFNVLFCLMKINFHDVSHLTDVYVHYNNYTIPYHHYTLT